MKRSQVYKAERMAGDSYTIPLAQLLHPRRWPPLCPECGVGCEPLPALAAQREILQQLGTIASQFKYVVMVILIHTSRRPVASRLRPLVVV